MKGDAEIYEKMKADFFPPASPPIRALLLDYKFKVEKFKDINRLNITARYSFAHIQNFLPENRRLACTQQNKPFTWKRITLQTTTHTHTCINRHRLKYKLSNIC